MREGERGTQRGERMPAMGRRVKPARGGAAAASLGLMSAVWSLAVCASEGLMIVAPESDASEDPTFVPVTGLPDGFMMGQPAWDESALSAVAFGYGVTSRTHLWR